MRKNPKRAWASSSEIPSSGGTSATALDSNTTAQQDLRTIIPLVLLVVLVILMILLRSIVAPVLLVLATVLSFGTAIGVSALVFNEVLGFPGADPSVPLYGFVFLVALGVDYTIFLMTRAREEAVIQGTRPGVLKALTVTGGPLERRGHGDEADRIGLHAISSMGASPRTRSRARSSDS